MHIQNILALPCSTGITSVPALDLPLSKVSSGVCASSLSRISTLSSRCLYFVSSCFNLINVISSSFDLTDSTESENLRFLL